MTRELTPAVVAAFTIRCDVAANGSVTHYPADTGPAVIGTILPWGGAFRAKRPGGDDAFVSYHKTAELAVLALLNTYYTPPKG